MSPRHADGAVSRFFDALVWNWLIGGADAHAKNYSVLLSGGQVRLAPLYDVASALLYETHERKLRLAMKIGGEYRIYPLHDTWVKAASEFGIDPQPPGFGAGTVANKIRVSPSSDHQNNDVSFSTIRKPCPLSASGPGSCTCGTPIPATRSPPARPHPGPSRSHAP